MSLLHNVELFLVLVLKCSLVIYFYSDDMMDIILLFNFTE